MGEIRRIRGTEAEAFKRMHVASDILDGLRRDFHERAGLVKWGRRDLAAASTMLNRVFAAMLDTVPIEQLQTMHRNLQHASFWTGARRPGERDNKTDFGMWISWDAVNGLIEAARERCVTCERNPQEQRQCPLAKALDQLPAEKDETTTGCGWYGRL